MCFVLVAWQSLKNMPLIIAANRDESYARPTRSLHRWPTPEPIYAGKDIEAGGTWFGVNQNGRFAIVTNVRSKVHFKSGDKTRGDLVTRFLKSSAPVESFAEELLIDKNDYKPFNLLFGIEDQLCFINQQSSSVDILDPGIYALSNASLDTPWPKAIDGKKAFSEVLDQGGPNTELLFDCLYDETIYPDEKLPDTGVPLFLERQLSARFINGEHYGTRSSTICTFDAKRIATVEERNHTGNLIGDVNSRFTLALHS
jgi:uncharacterized protein with NRDE domain